MTGSQDGRTLAVDEDPERVPIAGEDGIHSGAFIGDLGADDRSGDW